MVEESSCGSGSDSCFAGENVLNNLINKSGMLNVQFAITNKPPKLNVRHCQRTSTTLSLDWQGGSATQRHR